MLQKVSSFHKAVREEQQISAAYSQSLQALSDSKAQAAHLLQSTVERLEKEADQAKTQLTFHIQSLQNGHTRAMAQMQADLKNITEQLQAKQEECEAKRILIANDQKITNVLKSKLASVRTELIQMQQQK
ncbi:hypothetical protein WJX74_008955 [Apatococcus lobatus]|uniref:Uncharacterized protein n=1 Tax=Apatococcus lobatus TaxID=904363 RepID=A0AAW1S718_9CHLO